MSFDKFIDKLTLVPREFYVSIGAHEGDPEKDNGPYVSYSTGFGYVRESDMGNKNKNAVHDLLSGPLGRFKIGELEHHLRCDAIPLLLEKPRACVDGEVFSMELGVTEEYTSRLLSKIVKTEKDLIEGKYNKQMSDLDPKDEGEVSLWLVLAVCGKPGLELSEFFDQEKQLIISKPETYHVTYGYQFEYKDSEGNKQTVVLDLEH